ncbi:MAG: translation initiation factor IF-3 [Patescibacteria group bacterium]
MRISRKKRPEKIGLQYRINEEITSPQLRVVDDEGNFLGIMALNEALQISRDKAIDLVEIVPKANPPVAKLIDYGKFKYQKEKELKKQKSQQKTVEVKGIRLSLRIGEHDFDLRTNQAIKFLEDGDKVKVELLLKGREKGRPDLCREVINGFVKKVGEKTSVKIEQPLNRQGGKFFMIIAPNK